MLPVCDGIGLADVFAATVVLITVTVTVTNVAGFANFWDLRHAHPKIAQFIHRSLEPAG